MAKRRTTVHAAGGLLLRSVLAKRRVDFLIIVNAFLRGPLGGQFTGEL